MKIETLARCDLAFDGETYRLQPGARAVLDVERVATGEVRLSLAAPLPALFDVFGGDGVEVSPDRFTVRVARHTRDGFPADGDASIEITEAVELTPAELAVARRSGF